MLHCKDHFVRNLDELTDAKFTEFGGNGNRTVNARESPFRDWIRCCLAILSMHDRTPFCPRCAMANGLTFPVLRPGSF